MLQTKFSLNDCEYMKVIYFYCGERREYENDLRSNERDLSSGENQGCTGFEPMTSAIPVQRSTN